MVAMLEFRAQEQAREQFAEVLADAGLELKGLPVMDGKLHHVPAVGGKKGNNAGVYVGHLGGVPAGWFKNYRTDEEQRWRAVGIRDARSADEVQKDKQQSERLQADEARKRAEKEERIAAWAQTKWERSKPAAVHPYLERKDIQAHGLRVDGKNRLLVPMRDLDGKLWSLQSISEDGEKHYTAGGRKQALHALIGTLDPRKPLAFAEGFATAATLHQATGLPVAVAFDSGNLRAVAESYRERYAAQPLLFAADNDHQLPLRVSPSGRPLRNIGQEKAEEAAQAMNGTVLLPLFEQGNPGTDWNDYAAQHGIESVRRSFEQAMVEVTSMELQSEQDLLRAYREPAWQRLSKPQGFGAVNVNELWKAGTNGNPKEPEFGTKEGGIYQLVSVSGKSYVVPEPGIHLTQNYLGSEGFNKLFDTPGITLTEKDASVKLELMRPALVERAGDQWIVVQRGEVADAQRVNQKDRVEEGLENNHGSLAMAPAKTPETESRKGPVHQAPGEVAGAREQSVGAATPEKNEILRKLTRAEVEAALAQGSSLRNKDMSGLDLSGLRFEGVDLSGSNLSKTRNINTTYEASRLDGADLSDAVFRKSAIERVFAVNSRWNRAHFDQTSIIFNNFGRASFRDAAFRGTVRSVDREEPSRESHHGREAGGRRPRQRSVRTPGVHGNFGRNWNKRGVTQTGRQPARLMIFFGVGGLFPLMSPVLRLHFLDAGFCRSSIHSRLPS
jgi:phage/plasmid primase-like uncharacterized protein